MIHIFLPPISHLRGREGEREGEKERGEREGEGEGERGMIEWIEGEGGGENICKIYNVNKLAYIIRSSP